MLPITAPRHIKALYWLNQSNFGVVAFVLVFPATFYWVCWSFGWLFNDGQADGIDNWNFDRNWLILAIVIVAVFVTGILSEEVKNKKTLSSMDERYLITKNYRLLNKDNRVIAKPAVLRHYELNKAYNGDGEWEERKKISKMMSQRDKAVRDLLATQKSRVHVNMDSSDLDIIEGRIQGHKELDTLALK